MATIYKPGRPVEYDPFGSDPSHKPPKKKGEYRILSKSKEGRGKRDIEYIGVTNNLERRMKEHIKSGKLNDKDQCFAYKVADGRTGQGKLNDHERKKIKEHKPPLNQRGGGAGRPYGKNKKPE